MTLAERLASARAELIAAGVDTSDAAVDVDLYAREILRWDRATLLSEQRGEIPSTLEPAFSEWIARRCRHEPTAYIVGKREFWGLEFRVTPAVLIPRPETEIIVEEALGLLDGMPSARVADIGTGSGCLAVAIAHEVPGCHVVATDISEGALTIAMANAERHVVGDRITFIRTSFLDSVPRPFELIVANPPYVAERDRSTLSGDVLHEPATALFGGMDGLRDITGVLDASAAALTRGGWLLMEFGAGQDEDVRRLVRGHGDLHLIRTRTDLHGILRTAVVRRN